MTFINIIYLIIGLAIGIILRNILANYITRGFHCKGLKIKHDPNIRFIKNDTGDWKVRFKRFVLEGHPTFIRWIDGTLESTKVEFWDEIRYWSAKLKLGGGLAYRDSRTGKVSVERGD